MVKDRRRNQTPRWFNDIPKEAPKWICTLHESLGYLNANTEAPNYAPLCCPHIYRRITHEENNNFIVWTHAGHEFIKCFDVEIAQLIGTNADPNKYELASADFTSTDYFVIEHLRDYKIIQPFDLTLKLAHKLGLEGSFRKYDEIILSLAKQVGDKLTEEHEKTFNWYEKLRNLALNNPEPAERFIAMQRAYERGRRLIDQFRELTKPPPEEEMEDWHIFSVQPSNCYQCQRTKPRTYSHFDGRVRCLDCIKQFEQPPKELRCCQCGTTARLMEGIRLYHNKQTGEVYCTTCMPARPLFNNSPMAI